MVTLYKNDDASAPALTYTTAQTSIAHFAAFKVVLKACLVTGYGAKAGAGWELISEGTNYLVLRNGSHSGYVCFSWLGSFTVNIYLAATYTGVTNNVMTGDGLKSGVSAGVSLPQKLGLAWFAYSSAISRWYLIADEKTFLFGGGGYNTDVNLAGVSTYALKPLYIGEDSRGNFIALGGNNSTVDSNASINFFKVEGMTVLRDPDTGLLVDSAAFSPVAPLLGYGSGTSWKIEVAQPLESISFSKAPWGKSGGVSIAGYLRGVALPCGLAGVSLPNAIQSLGGTGVNLSSLSTPIPLGGSYVYLPGAAPSYCPTFFATNDPGFW